MWLTILSGKHSFYAYVCFHEFKRLYFKVANGNTGHHKLNERKCNVCNKNDMSDEHHYLFSCDFFRKKENCIWNHTFMLFLYWGLRPFHTFKVISSEVSYPSYTVPGQASEAVYQYLVPILSPLTDNCLSWISRRMRMVVEIVSWPNLNERMWPDQGSNQRAPDVQSDTLLTGLYCLAILLC